MWLAPLNVFIDPPMMIYAIIIGQDLTMDKDNNSFTAHASATPLYLVSDFIKS